MILGYIQREKWIDELINGYVQCANGSMNWLKSIYNMQNGSMNCLIDTYNMQMDQWIKEVSSAGNKPQYFNLKLIHLHLCLNLGSIVLNPHWGTVF